MANMPFVESPIHTAMLLGYRNPSYVADIVLPEVPVEADNFAWDFYPLSNYLIAPENETGVTDRPPIARFHAEQRASSVKDYAYDIPVNRKQQRRSLQQRNAGTSTVDPMMLATEGGAELMSLRREIRLASLLTNPANFGRNIALSGGDMFSSAASTILDIIEDARVKMLLAPNMLIANTLALSLIRKNQQVIEAVKGTGARQGKASYQELADLFEVEQIVEMKARVGSGSYNDSQSTTLATSRILGPVVALVYISPRVRSTTGAVDLTWGYTAKSRQDMAYTFFDPMAGVEGTDMIRVAEFCREIVSSPVCGTLISNVYAAEADLSAGSAIASTSATATVYTGV